MESVRTFPRRTFEQFLRLRTYQTHPTQLRLPYSNTPSTTGSFSTRPTQARLLHTSRRRVFPTSRFATRSRRFASTAAEEQTQNLSLSQRLRKLSREYGWSALGVYLLLSAADFPFCFLAVRLLGTDRIGHWEHIAVTWIKEQIAVVWPSAAEKVDDVEGQGKRLLEEGVSRVEGIMQRKEPGTPILEEGKADGEEQYAVMDHGYKEAEAANRGDNASLWTQLALAYAIHKSFIFIRVPLTAAVTPKVVKTLRGWGWDIGKRPAQTAAGLASSSSSKAGTGVSGTGVNTKGTGIKSD